jgi:hypothetical protein
LERAHEGLNRFVEMVRRETIQIGSDRIVGHVFAPLPHGFIKHVHKPSKIVAEKVGGPEKLG